MENLENKQRQDTRQFNKITIIGQLTEVNLNTRTYASGPNAGKEYISGTLIVKSMLAGEPNLFEVHLFANGQNKDGSVNKLFEAYNGLRTLLNAQVEVNGTLSENRYYSDKAAGMVSVNQLTGRYVNKAQVGKADAATFEISGFVNRELTEKVNKKGDVYMYELVLGQQLYNGPRAQLITFHVDPSKVEIVNHIQSSYTLASTVRFYGDIRWVTKTQTYEQPETAFGEAKVRTSTITNKNYYITGGLEPIDNEFAYQPEEIKGYAAAIASYDVELQNRSRAGGAAPAKAPATKTKATKLI
jgi:hypothetical protein